MILVWDTETTGLPDARQPPDHPSQPHLVQIAALLMEDDGTERAAIFLIVRPPIPVPDEAAAIHGITNAVAAAAGVSPAAAVGIWSNMARRAEVLVAHNTGFDLAVTHSAWLRSHPGGAGKEAWDRAHGMRGRFCTMRAAAPVVNLPPTDRMVAAGIRRPKSPKLEECIRHFFGEDLTGAHDALVDVRACARVYFHLRSQEAAVA